MAVDNKEKLSIKRINMSSDRWKIRVQKMAYEIRRRVLAHTISRNGGYLSQACSAAEIFAVLYGKVLRLAPLERAILPDKFTETPKSGVPAITGADYNGAGRLDCDNFILSPAQYALVLYATLIAAKRMDEKGMDQYDHDGSRVEMIGAEHSPGMELTTGSLGQGISQAAGIAWARKMIGERGRVVMLMSDGECQSGEFWEAVQAASFHRLGNMLIYVDMNGYQCDGKMSSVMNIEPFHKRLKAFGARVYRVDGHDIEVLAKLGKKKLAQAPTFVLCDTDPCRGIDILKNRYPKFHYVRFNNQNEKAEYKKFYDEMK
jgi:transketolase